MYFLEWMIDSISLYIYIYDSRSKVLNKNFNLGGNTTDTFI